MPRVNDMKWGLSFSDFLHLAPSSLGIVAFSFVLESQGSVAKSVNRACARGPKEGACLILHLRVSRG